MLNIYILGTTLIAGLLGLVGGFLLLWKESFAKRFSSALISVAAGSMLGAVFFDLLPESIERAGNRAFLFVLAGIILFFLIEKFLILYHCHEHGVCETHNLRTTRPLILLGDSVHNFLDGVVIATSFLVSVPLGIVAAIATVAHELPQEIGDFGVLLHSGMKKGKVLLWNFISGLASLAGAVLVILLADKVEGLTAVLLPVATGGFIYIAASDLIPELHREVRVRSSLLHLVLLFSGIAVIWLATTLLEG